MWRYLATTGIEPQNPGTLGGDANLVTSKGTLLAWQFNPLSMSPYILHFTFFCFEDLELKVCLYLLYWYGCRTHMSD